MRLSEKVVQRLMKQECLVVAKPKRRRYGSYLGEISPAPENLVNRDFTAAAPNEKWLTDIIGVPDRRRQGVPFADDRLLRWQVVSWSIGTRPDAELVNTMLDAAIETIAGEQRTACRALRSRSPLPLAWMAIAHHGCEADSIDVTQGCSPDNAACEGFFGRLKTELFYPRDWQTTSIEQFTQALDSYIRWYNEKRIKISLGALSPVEYRKSLRLAT